MDDLHVSRTAPTNSGSYGHDELLETEPKKPLPIIPLNSRVLDFVWLALAVCRACLQYSRNYEVHL